MVTQDLSQSWQETALEAGKSRQKVEGYCDNREVRWYQTSAGCLLMVQYVLQTMIFSNATKLVCFWTYHALLPRTGGKGLKATQVYPNGFGKRVCALHGEVLVIPARLWYLAGKCSIASSLLTSPMNPLGSANCLARIPKISNCWSNSNWHTGSFNAKVLSLWGPCTGWEHCRMSICLRTNHWSDASCYI